MKNRNHHPSPFCGAKGGRDEQSETQGVHTADTANHKKIPAHPLIPKILGSDK